MIRHKTMLIFKVVLVVYALCLAHSSAVEDSNIFCDPKIENRYMECLFGNLMVNPEFKDSKAKLLKMKTDIRNIAKDMKINGPTKDTVMKDICAGSLCSMAGQDKNSKRKNEIIMNMMQQCFRRVNKTPDSEFLKNCKKVANSSSLQQPENQSQSNKVPETITDATNLGQWNKRPYNGRPQQGKNPYRPNQGYADAFADSEASSDESLPPNQQPPTFYKPNAQQNHPVETYDPLLNYPRNPNPNPNNETIPDATNSGQWNKRLYNSRPEQGKNPYRPNQGYADAFADSEASSDELLPPNQQPPTWYKPNAQQNQPVETYDPLQNYRRNPNNKTIPDATNSGQWNKRPYNSRPQQGKNPYRPNQGYADTFASSEVSTDESLPPNQQPPFWYKPNAQQKQPVNTYNPQQNYLRNPNANPNNVNNGGNGQKHGTNLFNYPGKQNPSTNGWPYSQDKYSYNPFGWNFNSLPYSVYTGSAPSQAIPQNTNAYSYRSASPSSDASSSPSTNNAGSYTSSVLSPYSDSDFLGKNKQNPNPNSDDVSSASASASSSSSSTNNGGSYAGSGSSSYPNNGFPDKNKENPNTNSDAVRSAARSSSASSSSSSSSINSYDPVDYYSVYGYYPGDDDYPDDDYDDDGNNSKKQPNAHDANDQTPDGKNQQTKGKDNDKPNYLGNPDNPPFQPNPSGIPPNPDSKDNNKAVNCTADSKERVTILMKMALACFKNGDFDYKNYGKGVAMVANMTCEKHPEMTPEKAKTLTLIDALYAVIQILKTILKGNPDAIQKLQSTSPNNRTGQASSSAASPSAASTSAGSSSAAPSSAASSSAASSSAASSSASSSENSPPVIQNNTVNQPRQNAPSSSSQNQAIPNNQKRNGYNINQNSYSTNQPPAIPKDPNLAFQPTNLNSPQNKWNAGNQALKNSGLSSNKNFVPQPASQPASQPGSLPVYLPPPPPAYSLQNQPIPERNDYNKNPYPQPQFTFAPQEKPTDINSVSQSPPTNYFQNNPGNRAGFQQDHANNPNGLLNGNQFAWRDSQSYANGQSLGQSRNQGYPNPSFPNLEQNKNQGEYNQKVEGFYPQKGNADWNSQQGELNAPGNLGGNQFAWSNSQSYAKGQSVGQPGNQGYSNPSFPNSEQNKNQGAYNQQVGGFNPQTGNANWNSQQGGLNAPGNQDFRGTSQTGNFQQNNGPQGNQQRSMSYF